MLETITILVVFCVALAGVIKSASWIVSSTEKISTIFSIPTMVVGALIVGMSTSLPEFFIAYTSTVKGLVDVPVANVVGSNIAIIFLVLGIALLFSKNGFSHNVKRKTRINHLLFITLITGVFIIFTLNSTISFFEGLILLIIAFFYIYWIVTHSYKRKRAVEVRVDDGLSDREKKILKAPFQIFKIFFIFTIGVTGIILSSNILVSYLSLLAEEIHLPISVITITLLAIGSSVPEVAITIAALIKRKTEYIIGNVLGTVVFNIGFGVGSVALISSLTVDTYSRDIGLFLLVVSLIFIFFALYVKQISRAIGFISIGIFVSFLLTIITTSSFSYDTLLV